MSRDRGTSQKGVQVIPGLQKEDRVARQVPYGQVGAPAKDLSRGATLPGWRVRRITWAAKSGQKDDWGVVTIIQEETCRPSG